jgi:hypothetical protein
MEYMLNLMLEVAGEGTWADDESLSMMKRTLLVIANIWRDGGRIVHSNEWLCVGVWHDTHSAAEGLPTKRPGMAPHLL